MNFKKELPEDEQMKLLQNKEIPENKEKLILHNLRLVMWVVQKYHISRKTELDDLFQTGTIGLMEAIDKYDPNKGAKFSTVAVWYIQNSLRDNMFNFNSDISLDQPVGVEDGDITLLDTLEDENVNVELETMGKLFLEQFEERFKFKLTKLEYKIFTLFYIYGYSTQELAAKFNVSEKSISNTRNRAKEKIRKDMFTKQLWKEINYRTSFIRGVDYSQPKVTSGIRFSPVESIVLERERMERKALEELKENKEAN